MDEQNGWLRLKAADPGHSRWYVERFRTMAEQGADLAGEARLIDAMAPRGGRILDAGCGTGRVGAFLAAVGHTVVGVDLDPELIAVAQQEHPGPVWLTGDLAELDLPVRGIAQPFDVVVCAGNVMTFLAPATRVQVLRRMGEHLAADGRVVVGFGTGRGYAVDDFFADAALAGLRVDVKLGTWDLRPFRDDDEFCVAVLSRPN